MTQNSLSQLCFLNDNRHCLKVVLKETGNVLDLLKLSETLKASPLIKETAIYLSTGSLLASPSFYQDEPYLKAFFKGKVQIPVVLAWGQSLKTNPLVKEVYLRLGRFTLGELLSSLARKLRTRRGEATRGVPFFEKRKGDE